jgi:hypothetical protein
MAEIEWLKSQFQQRELLAEPPSLVRIRETVARYLPERIRRFGFLLESPTNTQSWLKVMLKVDFLVVLQGKLVAIAVVSILESYKSKRFDSAREELGIQHHIFIGIDENHFPDFDAVLLACCGCLRKRKSWSFVDFVPPRCWVKYPNEYESDDAFRIMRSDFKYVLREVMDGREPRPDKPSRAVAFAREFPNERYYGSEEATQIVKDYLEGRLNLLQCPQPMQEAIAVYQFTQSIRSIQANMTQSNMS